MAKHVGQKQANSIVGMGFRTLTCDEVASAEAAAVEVAAEVQGTAEGDTSQNEDLWYQDNSWGPELTSSMKFPKVPPSSHLEATGAPHNWSNEENKNKQTKQKKMKSELKVGSS